ncbi:MAG: Zn-dependent hydrolase [Bacteroidota bacterium]
MTASLPPIDARRVFEILDDLQRFTEGAGRTQRLALSKEDALARAYFNDWMLASGLNVETDPVGNQFGFRAGTEELACVGFGSHLDTVKDAGEFDGTLGMAVGMYFVEWLNGYGLTTSHPLCLINFTNEEGVRFVPSIMGSAYMAEQITLEAALNAKALEEDVTVKDELTRRNLSGPFDSTQLNLHCFLELHIEQGPVLEREEKDIGIVEGVQGMYWTEYIFEGRAQHTGTTPLNMRKNAGQAATHFVHEAYQLSLRYDQHLLSNGVFEVAPNAPNIIPSRARIILDSRNPSAQALTEVQEKVDHLAQEIAKSYHVNVSAEAVERYAPVSFHPDVISAVSTAVSDAGLHGQRMFSGAGHDAGLIGMKHPAGMIFIPSRDGISHNPKEYSSPDQIQNGLEVYIRALTQLANVLRH